jgi:hypothetical protein
VDNKTYYINDIDYDTSQETTIIDTGDLANNTMANQPSKLVFFNNNVEYQDGSIGATIYVDGNWITFDQIFISDASHFTYQNTTYALIGSQIKINDLTFTVIDTSWHGSTQVMDVYLQSQ